MTLVSCSENCEYQKDGFCQTPVDVIISNCTNSTCCYFSPNKKPEFYEDIQSN